MSEALSGAAGATQGSSGQTNSALNIGADLASETIVPTEREKAVFRALMNDTFLSTPEPFVTWIIDRVAQQGIPVGVSQILGFTQFTPSNVERVITQQATTSSTFTDLATPGPSVSGLADGQYFVLWGSWASQTGGGTARCAVQVNADAIDDTNDVLVSSLTNANPNTGFVWCTVKTVNGGGNNTISLKYRQAGGTDATFSYRWLVVMKFANA